MDATVEQIEPDRILVLEGGGASRALGALVLVGGLGMAIFGGDRLALVFGIGLALFGGALLTQHQQLILDRTRGTWSRRAQVFLVLRFARSGLLAELGSVQVKREVRESSGEHTRPTSFVYFPVEVPARTLTRRDDVLRFGTWPSVEDAWAVAEPLGDFLGRDVEDLSQDKA